MSNHNGRPEKSPGTTPVMPIEATTSAASGARLVTAALQSAGERTGVSFDILYNMAKRESSLDPSAKAKTSSAAGLFQFIEQTWLAAVDKYGARHGLGDAAQAIARDANGRFTVADPAARKAILDMRFDPMKAAALAGELIQENRAGLEAKLGRAVNAAELYAAHFLGLGGAAKLLTAAPDQNAAALLPAAARANKPVFYDGARARNVSEVLASIEKSMGLSAPDAKADAPEIKSAAGLGASIAGAFAMERRVDVAMAPSRVASAPRHDIPAMTENAPRGPVERGIGVPAYAAGAALASMTPLALVVLQALDPTRLGADRSDRPDRS